MFCVCLYFRIFCLLFVCVFFFGLFWCFCSEVAFTDI